MTTFPTFDAVDLGAGVPAAQTVSFAKADRWETPEHILVPPVFAAGDLEGLDFLQT